MNASDPLSQGHAWAKKLQAIAQTGINYSKDPYHLERFQEIRAIAAEILASASGMEFAQVLELFSHQAGYATPKVDTRGVVFREGRILMVKERSDHRWTLPGGWADVGDSPSEAVIREIREEAGYICAARKILAVHDAARHRHIPVHPFHVYKLFIRCEILSGDGIAGLETSEVGFFREGELPELSAPRATEAQIRRMFEHARHPEWPTDFD